MAIMNDQLFKLSAALQNSKDAYPLLSELWQQQAREFRTKFEAYIAAGFDSQQAMAMLCAEISKRG